MRSRWAELAGWFIRLYTLACARLRSLAMRPALRPARGDEPQALSVRSVATVDALAARVRQLELTIEAMGSGRPVHLGLPFTERAQALKMVREGRSARQIASTLGLPQGEILLLTRVQELQNGLAVARSLREMGVGETV